MFNPEWLKYIGEGEIIVLLIVFGGAFIFFKYHPPVSQKTCDNLRSTCNRMLIDKFESLEREICLKIENVGSKIETLLENHKDLIDRIDRHINGPK